MKDKQWSHNELEVLRSMFAEKISGIDQQIDKLKGDRQALVSMLEKVITGGLSLTEGSSTNGSDKTLEQIKKVYESTRGWVKAGDFRRKYELLIGKQLPASTLQGYHRKYEGKLFERRGDRRFTEWRLIRDSTN